MSGRRPELVAAAILGFYEAYWSSWIVGEVVRKRTEWIAERAVREGCDAQELRRRLRDSRSRVNALVRGLSSVFHSVDLAGAPVLEFGWLADPDDWPILATALVAKADILVTDNSRDFPLSEVREGILLLGSRAFLDRLYDDNPGMPGFVQEFLGQEEWSRG